ncbi:MAG TPA: nitroreductase family protein [Nitrospirota bacterium]|nr:nitroreductase family protein [Nitrospirota bacterium]
MDMKELVFKNRSYRRFHQETAVHRETLRDLVDLARLSATGGNVQPFKYLLSSDADRNRLIFSTLGWAAYLKDWSGPAEGEQPSAYIIILGDTRLKPTFGCDYGIAAQSILLGAVEKGLGGCIIATIRKPDLMKALTIPEHFEILLVIALGKPREIVVLEAVGPEGDIKYWRDNQGVHHVPKRSLDDLIVG